VTNLGNILKAWDDAQQSGTPSVLATVVRVEGSHYRRPGARMLAVPKESPTGSISGGCLEADLLEKAATVIRSGSAALAHYDTTTDADLLYGSGMGCGGAVDILMEPANTHSVVRLMEALRSCIDQRRSASVATVFAKGGAIDAEVGDRMIGTGDGAEFIGRVDESVRSAVSRKLNTLADTRRNGALRFFSAHGWVDCFMEHLSPPIALVLLGAGNDARPVCAYASELGWQVTVIDHRPALVNIQRFPRAKALHVLRPEEFGAWERAGDFDAAVIMTHHYQHDCELLSHLMSRPLSYIGLLGAARRAETMLNELRKSGLTIDGRMLDRLYAPVGLDLNADGPEEIALAIVAEIQMVLNGGSARPLRSGRSPARTAEAAVLEESR
jgi:xanthine dehydrogenase accessory factor